MALFVFILLGLLGTSLSQDYVQPDMLSDDNEDCLRDLDDTGFTEEHAVRVQHYSHGEYELLVGHEECYVKKIADSGDCYGTTRPHTQVSEDLRERCDGKEVYELEPEQCDNSEPDAALARVNARCKNPYGRCCKFTKTVEHNACIKYGTQKTSGWWGSAKYRRVCTQQATRTTWIKRCLTGYEHSKC